ncbi:MAG: dihydrofolate reductase [Flavobacteriaceae bacterium]
MSDVNSLKEITLIAAASENNVLGKDNRLIWHISDDLKRFKKLTLGHSIIMGRKTFESMPKALPNRNNIVLTRNNNYRAKNVTVAHDLKEAIELTGEDSNPYIIGGGEIYNLFLPIANRIELTRVHDIFDGDAFFPEIDLNKWKLFYTEKHFSTQDITYNYSYLTYKKIKS